MEAVIDMSLVTRPTGLTAFRQAEWAINYEAVH